MIKILIVMTRILGYWDTGILGYWDTGILGYRDTRMNVT